MFTPPRKLAAYFHSLSSFFNVFLIALRVAPFPHLSAIIFGALGLVFGFAALEVLETKNPSLGFMCGASALIFFSAAFFAEADARSRYFEYFRLITLLKRHGWRERLIRPLCASRCQRDAAKAAAIDAGYGKEIIHYFQKCGYRWHHVIPDAILQYPGNLFTVRFFRSSFFAKRGRLFLM